jgi:heme-degrading monooxygenase HmoA
MIVRVWRGKTSRAKAEGYGRFLRRMAYPDYGESRGNRGWMLFSRAGDEHVEFMLVSFWDSMQAVAQYSGGDPEHPKYYPEDQAALLELPERVEHFEVIDMVLDASGAKPGSKPLIRNH